MSNEKYTNQHEWVRVEGDTVIVGISDYAQKKLGDVVYVELPEVGRRFSGGEEAVVIESVKAASEIYAPVSGEVIAINDALEENPAIINEEAQGAGWIFKLCLEDSSEVNSLMDQAAYDDFLAGLE
ncbi:MAG: glycine cleavage system protein GcvH [Parvularculales bacterium]